MNALDKAYSKLRGGQGEVVLSDRQETPSQTTRRVATFTGMRAARRAERSYWRSGIQLCYVPDPHWDALIAYTHSHRDQAERSIRQAEREFSQEVADG